MIFVVCNELLTSMGFLFQSSLGICRYVNEWSDGRSHHNSLHHWRLRRCGEDIDSDADCREEVVPLIAVRL